METFKNGVAVVIIGCVAALVIAGTIRAVDFLLP